MKKCMATFWAISYQATFYSIIWSHLLVTSFIASVTIPFDVCRCDQIWRNFAILGTSSVLGNFLRVYLLFGKILDHGPLQEGTYGLKTKVYWVSNTVNNFCLCPCVPYLQWSMGGVYINQNLPNGMQRWSMLTFLC